MCPPDQQVEGTPTQLHKLQPYPQGVPSDGGARGDLTGIAKRIGLLHEEIMVYISTEGGEYCGSGLATV